MSYEEVATTWERAHNFAGRAQLVVDGESLHYKHGEPERLVLDEKTWPCKCTCEAKMARNVDCTCGCEGECTCNVDCECEGEGKLCLGFFQLGRSADLIIQMNFVCYADRISENILLQGMQDMVLRATWLSMCGCANSPKKLQEWRNRVLCDAGSNPKIAQRSLNIFCTSPADCLHHCARILTHVEGSWYLHFGIRTHIVDGLMHAVRAVLDGVLNAYADMAINSRHFCPGGDRANIKAIGIFNDNDKLGRYISECATHALLSFFAPEEYTKYGKFQSIASEYAKTSPFCNAMQKRVKEINERSSEDIPEDERGLSLIASGGEYRYEATYLIGKDMHDKIVNQFLLTRSVTESANSKNSALVAIRNFCAATIKCYATKVLVDDVATGILNKSAKKRRI